MGVPIGLRFQKLLIRTNSMQLIVGSIFVYFLASILIIYLHIVTFLDHTSTSVPKPTIDLISPKVEQLNLISNNVIHKNDLSVRGWWFDHQPFRNKVLCFHSQTNLCSKIFYTECKPDRIRAMYQFIRLASNERVLEMSISFKFAANDIKEQNEMNRSLGLQLEVQLSDDTLQYLSIEMPSRSKDWIQKVDTFRSNSGTYIRQLTIMLHCFGYSGTVMFTDVEIKPISYDQLVQVDDCKSKQEIDIDWNRARPFIHHRIESIKLDFDHRSTDDNDDDKETLTTTNNQNNDITLMTQLSMDRIQILAKTLTFWRGPVSLAIHIPIKSLNESLFDWQRIYLEKKLRSLHLHPKSRVSLVYSMDDPSDGYPINLLRNVAYKHVQTRYVLQIDADFIPCPDIENRLSTHLKRFSKQISYNLNAIAFVIPAFEYIELPKDESYAKSKEEHLQLIFREEPLVQPFRLLESSESHKLTNYWKWYSADSAYRVVGFSDKYEPYLLLFRHDELPSFDERFTGYGMNKISFINELFASGYQFLVLPDVWITHLPHRLSSYSQHFMHSVRQRLKNRALRFDFVCSLIAKYNLN